MTASLRESRQRIAKSQLRWLIADLLLWILMLDVASWVRDDLAHFQMRSFVDCPGVVVCMLLGVVVVGGLLGLYFPFRRVWPGSSTEFALLGLTHGLAGVLGVLLLGVVFPDGDLDTSVPLIAGGFVVAATSLCRSLWRWAWPRMHLHNQPERILVYGSGSRAYQYLTSSSPVTTYRPVGIFAEDPADVGTRIHGFRIEEFTSSRLHSLVDRTNAKTLLIITDEPLAARVVRGIKKECDELNVTVLILPLPSETLQDQRPLPQPRELNIADLIGRQPVELDESLPRGVLTGKRVLITGAGGTIGSEIARQVHRFAPAELILVDRDEGGLHAVELSLFGTALLNDKNTVLADIRDPETINALFAERRPQVVFHAAALKHQPLLETYPAEAVQTNVIGTETVLAAAAAVGVDVFVNISTDKAVNPVSVLGESKRAAERLTAQKALEFPGKWVSVRFGNVFGSRGSVIYTFLNQIANGGPVTVTDPNVERFFMSIEEASQLVLQAAALAESGETMVLSMGKPVRIADLAQHLIDLYDDTGMVTIEYTTLRPGEKLSEELIDDRERPVVGDRHPALTEVTTTPLPFDGSAYDATHNHLDARRWLIEHGESCRTLEQSSGRPLENA